MSAAVKTGAERGFVEVSSGQGPWEVRRFAAMLAEALRADAAAAGLHPGPVDVAGELAEELERVARPGALLLLSFDEDRSDDRESKCRILEDGTHQYYEGRRAGMLFRPYTNDEIRELFESDWELTRWEGDDVTVPRRALYRRR